MTSIEIFCFTFHITYIAYRVIEADEGVGQLLLFYSYSLALHPRNNFLRLIRMIMNTNTYLTNVILSKIII